MTKKREENDENMTIPPRKVEHLKRKAKEAPKQKAKVATMADLTPEQTLLIVEGMMKKQEALLMRKFNFQKDHLLDQMNQQQMETQLLFERGQQERIIDTIIDTGYDFRPSDGMLLDSYLRNRILGKQMDFCPIKEVNVYEDHPRALIGKSRVPYFFTRNSPNQIQPGKDFQGNWILSERKDVFHHKERVSVKQVLEYCEAGLKSEYKIVQYQLDPGPEYKGGPWVVCKLYNDAHSEL